jgi:hypothetical protein
VAKRLKNCLKIEQEKVFQKVAQGKFFKFLTLFRQAAPKFVFNEIVPL